MLNQGKVLEQDAAVNGHVIDSLPGLVFDRLEQVVRGQRWHLAVGDRLIDRHCPDRHRARGEDGLTGLVDQPARAQVHDRVGAPADRELELRDLLVEAGGGGRIADVGVDLHPGDASDSHRIERAFEVDAVGRDDQSSGGDLVPDRRRREFLALADPLHLRSDFAGGRELKLRGVT